MAEVSSPTPLTSNGPNALARALGLLGDEWTLLLLRFALLGATRYNQFRAELPISYAVLTARLETLVQESLLERQVYQENPVRAEYVLTTRGRSVWPILLYIWDWERKWVPEHPEALPTMRHRVCGAEFAPRLCCSSCDKQIGVSDVDTDWGPSGSWPRSVPDVATRRRSRGRHRGGPPGFFPETMAMLGNRWSAAVVGAAFQGVRRFSDFQDSLGIPPSLLTERLHDLCAHGVLTTVRIQGRSDRAEYRLTEKGRGFFPIVVTALQWAERWYRAPEGPALRWHHRECGAEFLVVLTCDHCAAQLSGADIDVEPRRGFGQRRGSAVG
ncbi:helix-turn-helix domain-containing protein [Nocardia sp. CNY236]|uniref:winged helix-turn-helix transcriptional regulator n=1 Tax=Nocardia sp. CNY236 TaxID=1169152 RepID=UPI00040A77D7|nr:helix-turn-helix domain-containing protein [Nocardia sp. CNY236]